jgi:spermidine synthase
VEDPDKKYDIVVFNNFVDGDIPYRLATREFFKKIWIMMELGGLCVVHAWEREETPTVDEILVTMQDVFPEVYMMEVPNTNSVILMGSRRKGQTTQEQAVDRARDIMQETPLSFDLAAVVQRQYQYATKMRVDARVLTDEDAPLSVDEE